MSRHLIPIHRRNLISEPFSFLRQEIDKIFDTSTNTLGITPEFEIKENKDGLSVTAELPGVSEKDINVTLENGVLTISGEKKSEEKFSEEKFFLNGKDNDRNFWSQTVDPKWYTNYDRNIHIIGGLFGGKKDLWDTLVPMFENYADMIIEEDKRPFPEELFMTLMYHNHPEYFVRKHFDTWWCRDNAPRETPDSYFVENKSFYKILEELNNINE